jgi:hypothetical protein
MDSMALTDNHPLSGGYSMSSGAASEGARSGRMFLASLLQPVLYLQNVFLESCLLCVCSFGWRTSGTHLSGADLMLPECSGKTSFEESGLAGKAKKKSFSSSECVLRHRLTSVHARLKIAAKTERSQSMVSRRYRTGRPDSERTWTRFRPS